MTRVKICGIKDKEHALAAVEAGADFIGLVFAPSPRQVEPDDALEIARAVKDASDTVEVVGVFVNMPPQQVNLIATIHSLDRIQLSGNEPWEYCRLMAKPIIKAVHIPPEKSAEEVLPYLEEGEKMLTEIEHIYLLDTQVAGRYGGTGKTFPWELARQAAQRYPVIIAGGLDPDNVAQAIEAAAPWGVDVSSGVETGGVKDTAKIKAFIEAVRKTDDSKRQTTAR